MHAEDTPSRTGEAALGSLAALVIFNVILSNTFQETLFLAHHPRGRIPLAMFLGSLITAAAAFLTQVLLKRLSPARTVRLVLAGLGLCTVPLSLWNLRPGPASTWALFLFVELSTTLSFAATWTYFQAPLSPSETRRLMPRLSAWSGGGGLCAGALVPLSLRAGLSPSLLIVVSAVAWLLAALLVRASHAPVLRRARVAAAQSEGLKAFLEIPMLGRLVLASALVLWAGLLVQYETRVVLQQHLQPERIAGTMALLLSSASVSGIAVQLLLAPSLLERAGVGVALALLPLCTALLVGGYLAMPVLPLLAGAFWADKVLRANLNRPAESCLLSALPPTIRPGVLLTLSGVVTPLLKATGALALLALGSLYRPGWLLLPVVLMSVGLLMLSHRWGRLYAQALSRTLEEGSIEGTELMGADPEAVLPLLDGPRLAILLGVIDQGSKGSARSRQLALDLLRPHRSALVRRALQQRLQHADEVVRIAALRWFAAEPADAALLARLRASWAQQERSAAERIALLEAAGAAAPALIEDGQGWLEVPDLELRKAVLRALLGAREPARREAARAVVDRLLQSEEPAERVAGLELCASTDLRARLPAVLARVQDRDLGVRRAAVTSLGSFAEPEAQAALFAALQVPALAHRAVDALTLEPERHQDAVLAALALTDTPPQVRAHLLRAVGLIGAPAAVTVLLRYLSWQPPPGAGDGRAVALLALRALHELRRRHPRALQAAAVRQALQEFLLSELRHGLLLLRCREQLGVLPLTGFLSRELEAQIERSRQLVLSGLQLLAPPDTLAHVLRALQSPASPYRDQAKELLRVLLREAPLRVGSLKLLDETTPWSSECERPPLLVVLAPTKADAVRWLLTHGDRWLRAALRHDPACPITVELTRLRATPAQPMEDPMEPSLEMLIFLKDAALFEALSNPQLVTVARLAESVSIPAGHTLFRQGDAADSLYLVVSGRLQVNINGRQAARLGVGACIGEMGVLASAPRSGTVVSLDACRLLRFDAVDFLELLDSYPEICRALLRSMTTRLMRSAGGIPQQLVTITDMVFDPSGATPLEVLGGVGGFVSKRVK